MTKLCTQVIIAVCFVVLIPQNVFAAYNGPPLKVPMASGDEIVCTTSAGGGGYHMGNSYYSLDFDDRYSGDLVLAAAAGVVEHVVNSGCTNGGTTCSVKILHSGGYVTNYLHMVNGSIPVNEGDHVIQGQVLGVIGNTGDSSGTHLHFEIKHRNGSDSGSSDEPTLSGVTLDGILFTDYEVNEVYESTNFTTDAFTYAVNSDPGYACYGPRANAGWIYWCEAPATEFERGYKVKSQVEINDIIDDFRFKVETWKTDTSSAYPDWTWTGDWNDVPTQGWDRSYFMPEFWDAAIGDWEFRIFVETANDEGNPIHIDTLPFTVTAANYYYDYYSYRGRYDYQQYDYKGYTCYGPVTGGEGTNWVYSCSGIDQLGYRLPVQSTFYSGERVYALVQLNDIRVDHRFRAYIYHGDTLVYTETSGWNYLNGGFWDKAYFFPYVETEWVPEEEDPIGEWRFEIYLDTGGGFEPLDVLNFTVRDFENNQPYEYQRNGTTCHGPVTGGESTNWIYTCENEATIFNVGDTVQSLFRLRYLDRDFNYMVEAYKNGEYQWYWEGDDVEVYPNTWNNSYFWPTLSNAQAGDWQFRIYVDVHDQAENYGYMWVDTIKFKVIP